MKPALSHFSAPVAPLALPSRALRAAASWMGALALTLCIAPVGAQADTAPTTVVQTAQADEIGELLTQGKQKYKNKDFEGAAKAFEQVLAENPGNYDAAFGLGRAYERLRRYDDAAANYEGMKTLFADRPEPLYRLGIVYRKMKRYKDSVLNYRSYIKARPEDPDPHYGLGESLREMGDAVGAIKAFESYVALETRPEEQKYVERAQKVIGELQAAREAASAPTLEEVEEPAEVPEETAPVDEAPEIAAVEAPESLLDAAPEVAAMTPEEARSTMSGADAAFAAGKYELAALGYHTISQASAEAIQAHYKLGVTLAVLGEYGAAIDAWERAEAIDPDFEAVSMRIEGAKRRLAVDAVLDREELAGAADERRALTGSYLEAQRYQMALRAAEALVAVAPDDPTGHRMRAVSHLALADPAGALDALEAELALQPGDYGLYVLMGQAYEELDDTARSLYFYELYLDTTDPDGADPANDELRARVAALSSGEAVDDDYEGGEE